MQRFFSPEELAQRWNMPVDELTEQIGRTVPGVKVAGVVRVKGADVRRIEAGYPPSDDFMSVAEAAEKLQRSETWVRQQIEQGDIPCKQVGARKWLGKGAVEHAADMLRKAAPDGYLTPGQAAAKYGITVAKVYQLARKGRLEGDYSRGKLYVPVDAAPPELAGSVPQGHMTADMAAGRLDLSTPRVYQLIQSGELDCLRVGNRVYVPEAAVEHALARVRDTVTPAEAARITGQTPEFVQQLIRQGHLPAHRILGRLRILRALVEGAYPAAEQNST